MTTNAYVYILRCADGSFYVGSTIDLEARLWQHQRGEGAAYTRRPGRRPVELVYVEEFESIQTAFDWEKRIQNWSRAKRIALIERRYTDLPDLAERYAKKRRRERAAAAAAEAQAAANALGGPGDTRDQATLVEPGEERARVETSQAAGEP